MDVLQCTKPVAMYVLHALKHQSDLVQCGCTQVFCKHKYLHVKIASSPTLNSYVTLIWGVISDIYKVGSAQISATKVYKISFASCCKVHVYIFYRMQHIKVT